MIPLSPSRQPHKKGKVWKDKYYSICKACAYKIFAEYAHVAEESGKKIAIGEKIIFIAIGKNQKSYTKQLIDEALKSGNVCFYKILKK
jgi:hypothetical protein